MAIDNAKILNVRIKNKYDSYENWASSNLVLEKGEIAIAYTTVDVTVGEGTAKHPALLMKVGDGTNLFKDLPWVSAKAADVLSVCKNENDLKTFVNNVIADAGIATDDALTALAGRVTTAEGAITTLNNLVGTTAVSKQISDAIAALNLASTYEAKGEAAKVDTKLTTEVTRAKAAEEANAAAAKKAQDEVDALEIVVNTLTETVGTKAAQTDLEALAGKVGEVPADKTVMGIIGEIQENAYDDTQLRADMATELAKKADKTQVATDIADAVKVETDARVLAVQGVQDEVDALEQEHATDKKALEDAIALKANQTALDEVSAVANAAVKQADYDVKVKALEDEDARIVGLVEAEATKAREEEGKLATAIKAITDDYLVEADKTELNTAINTEKERALAAEKVLTEDLAAEIARAKAAEKANSDAIALLVDSTTGDETKLNSIKELATWIEEHGGDAAEMAEAISDNAEAIAAIYAVDEEGSKSGVLVSEIARVEGLVSAEASRADAAEKANAQAVLDEKARAEAAEKANADAIKALQEANAEGGAVANAIADAKKAGTDAAAAVETLKNTEVKANADAIAQEVEDREAAIAQEVTDRNDAIADAIAQEVEDRNDAIDTAIATEVTNRNTAITEAIAQEVIDRNAAIATAKGEAATDATNKANAAQAAAEATAAADATAKANAALAAAKEDSSNKDAVVLAEAQKAIDATNAEVAKKANTADLAPIAFSGKTDDLVQGDMVLVFDCGTSAI